MSMRSRLSCLEWIGNIYVVVSIDRDNKDREVTMQGAIKFHSNFKEAC